MRLWVSGLEDFSQSHAVRATFHEWLEWTSCRGGVNQLQGWVDCQATAHLRPWRREAHRRVCCEPHSMMHYVAAWLKIPN